MTPDSKYFKGKLMTRWFGPYLVGKFHENGFVQIRRIDLEGIQLLVNVYLLEFYRKPLSKEEFTSSIRKEMNVIGGLTILSLSCP